MAMVTDTPAKGRFPCPRGRPGLCFMSGVPRPGSQVRGAEPGLIPVPPSPADPSLSPSPAATPPAPGTDLSYLNGTFRLLQKPLRWHDALLLCESRNASLAHVFDPYTQAFLTQATRGLRTPLWIGLASEEVGSQGHLGALASRHGPPHHTHPDFPPLPPTPCARARRVPGGTPGSQRSR